jgi:hypothetical protein
MSLLQLYMVPLLLRQTAVETLEEHHDDRYLYFNNKIYSLMVRKEVIEELHKDCQGKDSKKEAL